MLAKPRVQLAAPSDAAAISVFSRDFIEHDLGWDYTSAKVLRAIASTTTNVAVIRESGRLLGFGIMDYGDTSAHLVLFGVQPNRRRRGLGKQLLLWLEQCARVAGVERIRVEARADNPAAIAFYEAQGFKVLGRMPRYYRGVMDAIRLEKTLGIPGA